MMKPRMFSRVAPMSIFAAVMLSSATLFATQLLPIAPRDPALIGPINDETGSEKVIINAPPTAVVPEPTTWGMLLLGGGLLAAVRRFRRKHT